MTSNDELLLELRSLKQRVAEIEQQLSSSTTSSAKQDIKSSHEQGHTNCSTGKQKFSASTSICCQ